MYLKAIIRRAERTTHPGHRVLCRYLSREKEVLWPLLLLYCTKWGSGKRYSNNADLVLLFLAVVILIRHSGWSICNNSQECVPMVLLMILFYFLLTTTAETQSSRVVHCEWKK